MDPTDTEKPNESLFFDGTITFLWQGRNCKFVDCLSLVNQELESLQPLVNLDHPLTELKQGKVFHGPLNRECLIGTRSTDRIVTLTRSTLISVTTKHLQFRLGRYYPRSILNNSGMTLPKGYAYGRIMQISGENLVIDFNHPLAGKDVLLTLQVQSIYPNDKDLKPPKQDLKTVIWGKGIGMQDSLTHPHKDLLDDQAFRRIDENDDALYFAEPDLKPFWDTNALRVISNLYDRLIPHQAHILDLMAGVHSPIEDCVNKPARLTCAGLNPVELQHNPVCDEKQVLNVNRIISLPYHSHQFDTVLIHAAIEYVTQPELLIREIHRILKPSGLLIISFTNRYVENKAIQAWRDALPYERFRHIITYLSANDLFNQIEAFSWLGLRYAENMKPPHSMSDYEPIGLVVGKTSSK